MVKKSDKKFWLDFRRFFLRGLATLLPTVLTIVLLVKCYEFIQENISVHLTEGVIHIVLLATDDYPNPADEDYEEYEAKYKLEKIDDTDPVEVKEVRVKEVRLWMLRQKWKSAPWSVVGFILAIILVYIVGRLLASFIGRKVWQLFEGTVQRIPGFKQVYPYIKQVTDYLFGENKVEFSRVVAVPYPRKGLWSLGLVTGAGFRSMHETADEEFLTVFIPSSPTPVTGYVIHVKKDEVIDVPITIEEALRFTVSGGVIVPGHEILPTQRIELKSASRTARIKATDNEKEE
jgi:uncharacterized membrane protein